MDFTPFIIRADSELRERKRARDAACAEQTRIDAQVKRLQVRRHVIICITEAATTIDNGAGRLRLAALLHNMADVIESANVGNAPSASSPPKHSLGEYR